MRSAHQLGPVLALSLGLVTGLAAVAGCSRSSSSSQSAAAGSGSPPTSPTTVGSGGPTALAVAAGSGSAAGSGAGSGAGAASAVVPPKRPGTCEAALDRYTELYVDGGPPEDRARRVLTMDQKRTPFLDDCRQRLADGKFTAEQLECAANAISLEAGAACMPPR